MTSPDLELVEYSPEKMQKEAERLSADIFGLANKQIRFLLIGGQIKRPVECVWLEPCFGMFQVVGHEDKGFMMISDLPKGTIILNQRVEEVVQKEGEQK